MSQIHQSTRHDSPCLWFATERPVVGRVFIAHRNGLVVATKLAGPPGGSPMDADDFANRLRREFGVVSEQDRSPASSWPFSEAGESFQATDLVDLSRLTDFQRRVMMVTARIPPGERRTYGEVAEGLGQPAAAMAVGQAMKSNPAPLVIPCHRVVGARKLGSWVHGQDLKRRLLAHEGIHLPTKDSRTTRRPTVATATVPPVRRPSLEERIRGGETASMEFKPNAGRRGTRLYPRHRVVKTVCGFLNAQGGELVIGVKDDRSPIGLAGECSATGKQFDPDEYERFLRDLLKDRISTPVAGLVSINFDGYNDTTVCVVEVQRSPNDPAFAQPFRKEADEWDTRNTDNWDFWVRDGNQTRQYTGERRSRYVLRRFGSSGAQEG